MTDALPLVLGVDPGNDCGWALLGLRSGDRVASGTWSLGPKPTEREGVRYTRLRVELERTLVQHRVVAVGYEAVSRHAGTHAAHVYGGIVAMTQGICEERGVRYAGVPVTTVKVAATRKGRAEKADMMAAAQARWGVVCGSDNEADALFVALCRARQLGGAAAHQLGRTPC